MEIRKRMIPDDKRVKEVEEMKEREYIYFNVEFNNFRDVSGSHENRVLDREEMEECECVLCLPESYRETGPKTPLVIFAHGSGGRVSAELNKVGGVAVVSECLDAGYAALDVNGSATDGRTLGCPEHIFALYRAYRYAVTHYNLCDRVLVAGSSMGGTVALNFANTFPSITLALGLFYPRLNIDGVEVDGHYCIGTWDKTEAKQDGFTARERITKYFRFPTEEWCDENTLGFNAYRTRSFLNGKGERVVIPPCPIKIWQGTADKTVDPVMAEEFVRSVRRSNSYIELHMLEGVGHGVNKVMKEELYRWFSRFA